jgi:hypothetical protein
MSKMALPAPLARRATGGGYWLPVTLTNRTAITTSSSSWKDSANTSRGVRAYRTGATRPERTVWDDFVEAVEAYNEWERASHLFSASSRLRPLEHYLA